VAEMDKKEEQSLKVTGGRNHTTVLVIVSTISKSRGEGFKRDGDSRRGKSKKNQRERGTLKTS